MRGAWLRRKATLDMAARDTDIGQTRVAEVRQTFHSGSREKNLGCSARRSALPRELGGGDHCERRGGVCLATLDVVGRPRVDEATATLMSAVARGLLLDRLASGDRARTDAVFARPV